MAYTKTTWQDLPNTTTPINAIRLNNIENGIKENDDKLLGNKVMGNIVVNSIETKNLFNKNTIVEGDIINSYGTLRLSSRQVLWLKAGTYTFSSNITSSYNYALEVQNSGVPPLSSYPTFIYDSSWQTATTKTFTINTAGYFTLVLRKSDNSAFSSTDITNLRNFNYQLETGSTATSYSDYQNLNNEELYTTGEQRIGRWINGKTLYRKTIQFTTGSSAYAMQTISLGITNPDIVMLDNSHSYIIDTANNNIVYYINSVRANTDTSITSGVHNWFRLNSDHNTMAYTIGGLLTSKPCTLTVEYTKTTD